MGYPGQFIGPNSRISDQAVQLQRNTRIGSMRLGSTGIAFAERQLYGGLKAVAAPSGVTRKSSIKRHGESRNEFKRRRLYQEFCQRF